MVKTVNVLGFPHAYELSAAKESPVVLVFVHGWLLSQAYWQPVIEQLASDYQCLAYDLRGFGQSRASLDQNLLTQNPLDGASAAQVLSQTAPESLSAEALIEKTVVSVASPASLAIDYSKASSAASTHVPGSPSASSIAASSIAASSAAASSASTNSTVSVESAVESSVESASAEAPATIANHPEPRALPRYTPAAYAQDLIDLLTQLQIKKAWVVGHSLGGSIALWAAHLAPETIEGVVCVNSGGGIYLKEEFERFRRAGEQLIKFRPRWLSFLPFFDLLLTRLNVHRPIARRWARQRLQDLLTADAKAALGSLLDSTTETEVHQLPQVVSQLQQPVHFIAGQQDTVMEPQYVRHLASFHASFESCGHNVSEIPDCGHLAMIEQPAATAAEIRSVLEKRAD